MAFKFLTFFKKLGIQTVLLMITFFKAWIVLLMRIKNCAYNLFRYLSRVNIITPKETR